MFLRISIFYVLTWFFLILIGGIQQATGLLSPEVGLPQLGPGIAGMLMLLIFRKDGHRIQFLSKETPFSRYLYAALIPVGLGLVVFLISSVIDIPPSAASPIYNSLITAILWMPIGALGEEIGWRGYLHKKLDTKMRGLFSSLLVGLLWLPIHITFLTQGAVFVFFLGVLIISYSIVIYVLVQDTRFNVLLASIFHFAINLTNLLFLDVIYDLTFMIINSLVWAVVATGLVISNRELFLASKGRVP
ncbi:MAG TPA: CPBP family intramembrane glutamic endopeptidase [Anaerolineales bacterium]|nr:CPBP family intramembrane glutamic endopeptidase [Anaerolineales bacterium]